MPALAEKYTVIAPDSRGMGDSQRTESGYDASTLAEDAFSLVRSLGFQQIFLVGHDLGVSTAYAYAARYREAVQRLVILDVPLEGLGAKSLPPNAPSGTSAFSRLLAAWRNLLPRDVSRSCFSGSSLVLRLQSRQRISRSTFVGILAETPYGPDLGIITRSQPMHSSFKSTAKKSYASRS